MSSSLKKERKRVKRKRLKKRLKLDRNFAHWHYISTK